MTNLPKRYHPVEVEHEILKFWKKKDIYQKTVEYRKSGPRWNFLEGPPTTNGFMHVGHARGRAMKDAQLRYMTMKGYNVWRRGGWDMQGLPVELEVEKNEGIAEKGEIESAMGLDQFVQKCKNLVDYYLEGWVEDSKRLGLWLDYEEAYKTRRDDYIEHVWHFLKLASEEGLLGRGYRVNPICPRCVTALSGHEVSQGYETKTDPSIYVKFKRKGVENEYLVIWTTTPFTIISNEMVSVHPDYKYVKVKVDDEYWWLVEDLMETVLDKAGVEDYEVVEKIGGNEMLGWKYEHPFRDEVEWHQEHDEEYMHAVVTGRHVTVDEGTGLVHTAPGFGPDDFDIGKEYGVPVFCPVTKQGRFTEEVPMFEGEYVFDTNEIVPKQLDEKGLLLHDETVDHEYPHCWRCDTPLIYVADSTQWFLKMKGVREKLVEKNQEIDWTPEWAGSGRFGDWVANADDWCISRSRVWGSPLPVWVCDDCQHEVVIGSRKELKEKAVEFPDEFELHRPWVDKVVLECPECEGMMHRESFVTDCWLDSGMAHTASVDYLGDESLFPQLFPYDFITEAVDQSRGWFYSLLYTGVVMHGEAPFKACVSQGHVLDEHGGKMSKSKGNVVWAEDAFDEVGADPFRLFMLSRSAPWTRLNYSNKEVNHITKRLDIFWNVFLFAETYMELDEFVFDKDRMFSGLSDAKLEEKWLVSRVQSVLKEFHEYMDEYLYHHASRVLLDFITEDLSRIYLPLVKRRVWLESDNPEKLMTYDVLFYTLQTSLRCMNIFTPYFGEKLHQDFLMRFSDDQPETINMADMPDVNESYLDEELEATFDVLEELRSAASHARNKSGIKLRHPVKKIMFVPASGDAAERANNLHDIMLEDLNTREFEVIDSERASQFIELETDPNYENLGPKFKGDTDAVVSALENVDAQRLKEELEEGLARLDVNGKEVELEPDDVSFSEQLVGELSRSDSRFGTVYVDNTRTRELEAEGLVRDVTRRVQVMRKEMDLDVEEMLELVLKFSDEESVELTDMFSEYLATETRAESMQLFGPDETVDWDSFEYVKDWEIDDLKLKVGMTPK